MLWYFLDRSIAKSLTSESNSALLPEHFDRPRGWFIFVFLRGLILCRKPVFRLCLFCRLFSLLYKRCKGFDIKFNLNKYIFCSYLNSLFSKVFSFKLYWNFFLFFHSSLLFHSFLSFFSICVCVCVSVCVLFLITIYCKYNCKLFLSRLE